MDIFKLKEEALKFLNFENNKKFLILTDDDEDGLTSALNVKKFIEKSNANAEVLFNEKRNLEPGTKKESEVFKEKFDLVKPDIIIFLDLNEDLAYKNLEFISEEIPVLIIDHHPSPVEIKIKNKLLVLKPTFSEIAPSQYSTTKIVYDIFGGDKFAVCVGLIGDSAFGEWKDFIEITAKENNTTVEKLTSISDIIKLNYSLKGDKLELFNFVYNNGIKKIIGSIYEEKAKDLIEHLKKEVERYNYDKEYSGDIGLAFFKTEKGFASKLSNDLSKLHTETIVVYTIDDYVKGSVRRNDYKVNCGELIKYAMKNSKLGNGGGHIPAGGFACPNEYFEEFKKRAKEYVKENPAIKTLK